MYETLKLILERKTGLYTTYITSFILFNWKFFFVLFYNSSSSGGSRISDALNEFTTRGSILGFDWANVWVIQFLLPALFTYIIIAKLPKLTNWAYAEHLWYQGRRTVLRSDRDRIVAKKIAVNKENELGSYQTTEELQEQINELMGTINELSEEVGIETKIPQSEEEKWQKEFTENKHLPDIIKQTTYVIYSKRGYVGPGSSDITPDVLAIAESYGLIQFNKSRDQISFTEKGLHFQRLVSNNAV